MKREYDFSKGKRGAVVETGQSETREAVAAAKLLQATFGDEDLQGKVRITIRLDEQIVDRFMKLADKSGGRTGYQTLINSALRQYLEGKAPKLEDSLRRIIREELKKANAA